MSPMAKLQPWRTVDTPGAAKPGAGTRRILRSGALLAGLAAGALASLLAMATGAQKRPAPVAVATAVDARKTPIAIDADATARQEAQRFALHALLLPLIDDEEAPRWAIDPTSAVECEPGTTVQIDGRPLTPGASRTTRHFVVHWRLQGCRPFGVDGAVWTGEVEVDVHHDGAHYAATVQPLGAAGVEITGPRGRLRLVEPFHARLE